MEQAHRTRADKRTVSSSGQVPQGVIATVIYRLHAMFTTLLLYLLSLGPIPRHVGFVMDGNRRYAKGRGMQTTQGHHDGFHSLRRVRL